MTDLPKSDNLILDLNQGWLTIWFNRADNRNALSQGLMADLTQVLETVRGDRAVRGITLRGKGGIFCAGGDLKAFKMSLMQADRETVVAASMKAADLFALINSMPQVMVMIVEGAAMAGGLGMACCGDVVIAAPDAKFALTETMIGISPAQISPYVVQKFGYATARRLMVTAASFDGTDARNLGLVDFLGADEAGLLAAENTIKRQVLKCAPGAVASSKALLLEGQRLAGRDMAAFAADNFADCLLGEEGREGVASFLEKRRPSWSVKLEENL
jgi:isohexenylglutaconyl-CoA hydratase